MPSWKELTKPRYLVLFCGLLGVIIPLWVLQNYVPLADYRAIFVVILILVGFTLGINELLRHAIAIETLQQEIQEIDVGLPAESQLGRLSPALHRVVIARLHGGAHYGGVGATYTPYLIGALVMLGLIGTFVGLVDTLSGTRSALQTTADVESLRNSLLAPIAGLARAFGTSVSGVATSVVLGLAATVTRHEEVRFNQLLSSFASGALGQLDPMARQTAALEKLVEHSVALQPVMTRFQDVVDGLVSIQEDHRKGQELLAKQMAGALSDRAEAIYADLSMNIRRFSEEVEPAIARVMGQATGFLDHAGQDLLTKVQQKFETSTQWDQERRAELTKMFDAERQARSAQELHHFERLTVHAKTLTDALQSHLEGIGRQYGSYLTKLEKQVADFDETWRSDTEHRRKESESQRRMLDTYLDGMRDKFAEQSDTLAKRHQELLERLHVQYQEMVERFGKQTSVLAEEATRNIAELSNKYANIVGQHEEDRQQLRKTWGIEQGRQQRQFDGLLEKMREDLEDRRRTDAEQINSLNGWAQQLVKRIEIGVTDKAAGWDAQFSRLIASLAETTEALRLGDRARIKEFKEIVQVLSEADRNRADELRRLILALRESTVG
jgi:hypothetical protein